MTALYEDIESIYLRNKSAGGKLPEFISLIEEYIVNTFINREQVDKLEDVIIKKLNEAVCAEFEITSDILFTRSQKDIHVIPRHICFERASALGFSHKDIAHTYCPRDPYSRSSITNGITSIRNVIAHDKPLRWKYERIIEATESIKKLIIKK
jgi:hypothetical protein